MKRVLIIEDETPAREHLERQLARVAPELDIVGSVASCAEVRAFLATSPEVDLIVCDIQLSDGSALELFTGLPAPAPIVFCTAYDQYVMEALEVGGVDYLLKPVSEERLTRALDKLRGIERLANQRSMQVALAAALDRIAAAATPRPVRFIVKRGADFVSVCSDDVAYFGSEHKLTLLTQRDGATSYVDESLNKIEARLESRRRFFRANRAFLVSHDAVRGFRPGLKGRLRLDLDPSPKAKVIVSQENAAAFKRWYGGDDS